MKVRLSKKFVLIFGGVLVLCGASGAAAVLVGAEKILGPSYLELNGLECTTLQTVTIKKNQRTWIRKYVTAEEDGDGMARLRTALRVAKAVQEKEKADLVQVAMIDKAGPKDRAAMRGRMIGAQVVYVPNLARIPEGAAAVAYSAYYVDGTPSSNGEYFGMRIDLPLEDVEHLQAKLTDKADCLDPIVETPEDGHGGGHGAKKDAHGKASGHDDSHGSGDAHGGGDGHGGKDAHGEEEAHGEAPHGETSHGETSDGEAGHGANAHGDAAGNAGRAEASAHGDAPAADGHGAEPAEGHDKDAANDGGGWLGSITGMFFGSEQKGPEAHGDAEAAHAPVGDQDAGKGHGASSAGAHEPTTGDHAASSHAPEAHGGGANTINGHGDAAAAGAEVPHGGAPAQQTPQASDHPATKEEQAGGTGFLDQVKGMIFGGSAEEAGDDAHEEAKASTPPASQPAPEPRTSAEGGKRWSKSSDKDEIRSTDAEPQAAHEAAQGGGKTYASGGSDADAAGAAWLEQFRAQQAAPAADAAKPQH